MPLQSSLDFFVQWHLTERCNLRCRHCYQSGSIPAEMSFQEIREGIDEIGHAVSEWSGQYGLDLGLSFNLTGGEPFFRADLFDIIREITERGYETSLLSNGTLVTEERAGLLAKLGVKGVQVSMEGPEGIHDDIRGRGSFQAALRGARHLVEAGLEVTLNLTLSEVNVASFRDMIRLAAAEGIPRVGFSRLVPAGRGLSMVNRMLASREVRRAYEDVFSFPSAGVMVVTGDPVAHQMRIPRGEVPGGDTPLGGCAAGFAGITILPDGTLLPCRRLPVPLGNIRSDSFREIWAASPVLRALRDRRAYSGKCRSCERWASCRGCRAIAWAWTSAGGKADFLAPDPQCFLE